MGFFDKLKKITTNLFTTYTEADEAFFEELEETLILSDFGMEIAVETVEKLREKVRKEKLVSQEEVRAALRAIIVDTLNVGTTEVNVSTSPCVFLFIGVNGVGKTTSIGKMANLLRYGGEKWPPRAGGTLPGGAGDPIGNWAPPGQAGLVRPDEGGGPRAGQAPTGGPREGGKPPPSEPRSPSAGKKPGRSGGRSRSWRPRR